MPIWPRLHATLLSELRRMNVLDLDGCAVDSAHVRAPKGGITSDPRPPTVHAPALTTT